MKIAALLLFVVSYLNTSAQHRLEKIWQTDSVVAIPESVLPDLKKQLLYISLIDGAPWEADGKGGIATLGIDGKNYEPAFLTGLNAPKGLGQWKNRLYVADISEVVVIDLVSRKITKKIAIDSAKGLNDITVSSNGTVYVSDSRTAKIWRISDDKAELYLENMRGVNGLRAIGDELYILSGTAFVKAGADKKITNIATLPQGGDGIEPIGNGDFLATSWGGLIYYVSANGTVETLLDTSKEKRNTADLGYDAVKRILYVPTFNAKTIEAYQLK
jgi:hypothetical protein